MRPSLPLLGLISAELILSHAASTTAAGHSSGVTSNVPTCQSGSVNYITDRLPQQCVVSSRTATSQPATTGSVQTSDKETATVVGAPKEQHISEASPERQHASSSDTAQSTSAVSEKSTSSESVPVSTSEVTGSTTTLTTPTPSPTVEAEEIPLDTANFLSFEEWKKKNLAKVGQSPEHVGQHRSAEDIPKRPRPGASNALDVLGEDTEIDLDFGGFGDATNSPHQAPIGQTKNGGGEDRDRTSDKPTPEQSIRSKDAGRTCKERTNYASFDCAATIMKTNRECKSASSVLVENKDSYMLNICSVKNKFFIVELCDDILIDTVVLANYEFFSSIFRTFRISVSDRYPAKPDKWRELGVYEARNTREVQPFLVEQSLIWARYLRIEILSHYGNEYYCPISLLRVHGTTMIEEFRHQDEIARGEYPEEVPELEAESGAGTASPALPQEPTEASVAADKSAAETPIDQSVSVSTESQTATSMAEQSTTSSSPTSEAQTTTGTVSGISGKSNNHTTPVVKEVGLQHYINATAVVTSRPTVDRPKPSMDTSSQATNCSPAAASPTRQAAQSSSTQSDSTPLTSDTASVTSISTKVSITTPTPMVEPASLDSPSKQVSSQQPDPSSSSSINSTSPSSSPSTPPTRRSPSSPPPPAPSTQESFFKSLHKRLSALESNATLSLQYIEHQSLLLRDAFLSHSKSQSSRTSSFLSSLNDTVRAELLDFRQQYDELWQSTVIELEGQRRTWEREMRDLKAGVERLGEEGRGLRVLVGVQSTLLLLCLGLVIFGRGAGTGMGGVTGWDNAVLRVRGQGGWGSPGGSPGASGVGPKAGWGWRGRSPESGGEGGDEFEDSAGMEGDEADGVVQSIEVADGGLDGAVGGGQEVQTTPIKTPLETQSSPSTPTGTRDVIPVSKGVGDVLGNGDGEDA
ncbi:UNC-like C-terminal-domain-containing protein [Elsinoe ampelina]|uniref:UNC-like C-terminal-domain-containing protein n=1 Tax=Elsinoe ampelina TaxID=302913 RepID=A0A6A6FZU1_9PEZI|nr:UNC-like C-terminal-domain-containing protein [Elsinoe ampelina]